MSFRSGTPSAFDLGAESGHETHFVFSGGDVRHTDADDIRRILVGKVTIP